MKLHYMGKYNMNPDDLPHDEHEEGAVKFREPEDPKTLGLIGNGLAIGIFVIIYGIMYIRDSSMTLNAWGALIAVASLVPHEILHALCFKGDVYMYTNLRHGMLFVTSTERISKGHFIFMSMLPNLVFGFAPFIIYLIFPKCTILGTMGLIGIASGAGDYINVFNAITQMPKGAYTYLHKFGSYWYMPR